MAWVTIFPGSKRFLISERDLERLEFEITKITRRKKTE